MSFPSRGASRIVEALSLDFCPEKTNGWTDGPTLSIFAMLLLIRSPFVPPGQHTFCMTRWRSVNLGPVLLQTFKTHETHIVEKENCYWPTDKLKEKTDRQTDRQIGLESSDTRLKTLSIYSQCHNENYVHCLVMNF